jgi:hypothetical protein
LLLNCTSLLFSGHESEKKKNCSNSDARNQTNANIVTSSVKCYNQLYFLLLLISQPFPHVTVGDDFIPIGVGKK